MISLVNILKEMSAPRSEDLARTYYHGTSTDKAANGILKNGIQPPDIELIKTKYKSRRGIFVPIEGKVYITPNLSYALIYSFGGDILGSSAETLKDDYPKGESVAYLFVISGDQLGDIQPDEDSVGAIAFSVLRGEKEYKNLSWIIPLMKQSTRNRENRWPDAGQETKMGKRLLKDMTDAQKLQLIDAGAHIAHTGPLFPRECWSISKTDAPNLRRDGSNFFDLANQIK